MVGFALNAAIGSSALKLAATAVLAPSATVQVPFPEHPPPDQPANEDSVFGIAVSRTGISFVNTAEQVVPQEIPAGVLLTRPIPVPMFLTDKRTDDVPTPFNETLNIGVFESLDEIVKFAIFSPGVVGLNATLMVQLRLAARVFPVQLSNTLV